MLDVDQKILGRYAQKLKKLRLGVTSYGKAPHKPVFLLTQIEQVEKGRVSENKFFITSEFVAELDNYFPDNKGDFLRKKSVSSNSVAVLEKFLLNESDTLPTIFEHPEIDQEAEFVRGSLFKKLIPQVYNHTCAITGMRLISSFGFSMIDACHIVPFRVSGDDRVTNGIALCPNLHRAFDRGLISVDDDFKVLVSKHFAEEETNLYSIKLLKGQSITLPFGDVHFPEKANFKWHREKIFKG